VLGVSLIDTSRSLQWMFIDQHERRRAGRRKWPLGVTRAWTTDFGRILADRLPPWVNASQIVGR
jgi:hypothetical protein